MNIYIYIYIYISGWPWLDTDTTTREVLTRHDTHQYNTKTADTTGHASQFNTMVPDTAWHVILWHGHAPNTKCAWHGMTRTRHDTDDLPRHDTDFWAYLYWQPKFSRNIKPICIGTSQSQ